MELTDVERATLRLILDMLEADPNAVASTAAINRILGPTWRGRIAERSAEYVNANQVAAAGGAVLSSSAQNYWDEAKAVLRYGRLALAKGSRKAEKALSLKCEALDESFAAQVPQQEQGMFLISRHVFTHDAKDWDERWAWTVDHEFPLLRRELVSGAIVIANPLREAQIDVLAEALAPPAPPSASSSPNEVSPGQRLRDLVRRLE